MQNPYRGRVIRGVSVNYYNYSIQPIIFFMGKCGPNAQKPNKKVITYFFLKNIFV
ncbi:hypothetical protein FM107_11220 [Sphingobacterium sp. JB170]|nr:hypothetical protein FM107_11220 [Sphingobacterium sp. JB170]